MRLEPLSDGLFRVFIGEINCFSVYGVSGGLVARRIAYLVKKGDGERPDTLNGDLGLPLHKEQFRIFEHGRGWKHAAVWIEEYEEGNLEAARSALLGDSRSNRPPFETFKRATCKGCYALGTACGNCKRCTWELARMNRHA